MLRTILDKFFLKQWAIGIGLFELDNLMKNGIKGIHFDWIEPENHFNLKADPFITKTDDLYRIFYEDFSYRRNYGNINCYTINKALKIVDHQKIMEIGSHLSYPFTIEVGNATGIIPESSKVNHLFVKTYNNKDLSISLEQIIIENQKLLDATLLFHNGKYWMFATKRGKNSNRKLYIYHSNRWDGDYLPHKKNPVKNNLRGSRSAGRIFKYQKELYRPAQNCEIYYGKSIIINKIKTLTENEFEEEECLEITANQNTDFNYGIHTINFIDNVLVIDGLRRKLNPFAKILIFVYKLQPYQLLKKLKIFS